MFAPAPSQAFPPPLPVYYVLIPCLTASPSLGSEYLKGPKGKCRKNINSATGPRHNGEPHYLLAGNCASLRLPIDRAPTMMGRAHHRRRTSSCVLLSYGLHFHASTCTERSRVEDIKADPTPSFGMVVPSGASSHSWLVHSPGACRLDTACEDATRKVLARSSTRTKTARA